MSGIGEPLPPPEPASAPGPEVTNEYDRFVAEAPKPAGNEYDQVIVDLGKERQQRVRANIMGAQQSTPAEAAKASALADKTGIPADIVERNLKKVEGDHKLNEYDAILERAPKLSQWLGADPVNAKVAGDDYESLGFIEKRWNALKQGFYGQRADAQALGTSIAVRRGVELEQAQQKADRGEYLTPFEKSMLAQAPRVRENVQTATDEAIGKLLENRKIAGALPTNPALREMNDADTFGGAMNAFLKDPLNIVLDLAAQNAPQLAVTTGATLLAGPIGGMAVTGAQSFGQEFAGGVLDNLQEMGIKTDDPEALKAAFANRELMSEVFRKSSLKAAVVASFDTATMGIAGKTLAPALKSPFKRQLVNVPAQMGVQMAGGAGGEALGSVVAGNEIKPGAVLAEAVAELSSAPADVFAMRHSYREELTRQQQVKFDALPSEEQHAIGNALTVEKLIEQASETKLFQLAPDKMQEFIGSLGDQSVFVPSEAVATYMQDMTGVQARLFAEKLGIADQLDGAIHSGQDIVIPLAKYVTDAGDAHAAWRNDIRTEVDGFSVRQAQEDAKVKTERLKLAVDRFEKQLEAGIAEVDATTRVYEDIRDKLKTLGQFTNDAAEQQAALFAERYAARAARNPHSYLDAWDAYGKAGPGTGLDIQTQLSERVGAYPPDQLDVLLNSIRSGKEAATEQGKADRQELKSALDSLGIDTGKMTNPQIRDAIKRAVEKTRTGETYEQSARGTITFGDNKTIISLFQSRDLSTLIHESGHLFLSELEFDAKAPDAPAEIKADWQAVLDWLGSKDGYITRDMHEQFARGFETYAMEGKAPSSALASAFRSFKRWLTQIYRRLAALDAPITPELRQVFDRLLATDEQIASAREVQGLNPIFKDAESAGMTEAEFRAYTARANAVVEDAEQKLLAKSMEGIRKQKTKEWKADERTVREEVTNEVMADPGQQALELLTKGALPVGETPEVLKGIKLAKEDVVALYGDETVLTMLPAGIYRDRVAGPGTISPDELAQTVGLGNGRELIERLMQLEAAKRAMMEKGDKRSPARAKIDEDTAQRMRERFGDPLNDGTIEQEAMAAVHSDKQAALMGTELRMLARKAGHSGAITWEDIKAWAADAIADKSVKDGTRFDHYARAEREAGKRVERALIKGDFVAAFKAKQDQMVNHALWIEARKASDDVDSARKLMDRYASSETLKNMDQEYLEQIHQLLETYEFKNRSGKFLAERKSFEEWAIEQEAKGFEVQPPPRLDKGLFTINYRQMTVDELRGLTDTVKQIAHLGRWKKEMLDGQKKRDYEAVVAEAVAAVQAIPQRGVSQVRRGITNTQAKLGDVGHLIRSADAALLKLETIFEWLDGDKTGHGVFTRAIFKRMAEAQTVERDLQHKLNKQLSAIHDKVPLEQRKRWNDILTLPELGTKLNRSQLIAVALNTGNEGNFDKLTRGEKWAPEAVEAALTKHLTQEEWTFVQDAWDLVNTLWPEVEAMERRVNGVAPPKVEARAVATPFGALKGGYYPAVYDPTASVEGDRIDAKKAEGLFDPAYRKATTRAGSTRKRTGAAYPMLLSLQVIGQHLNEVAHDVAFREPVIDAYRFLSDKRIKEAVNEALGPEYSKQFEPWVKHIANEWAIDRKGVEGVEKFADVLRTNTTAVGMGFRLSTMLSQVAGYANSIQRLGTAGMASGMRAFLKNPAEAARTVQAKSGEMRHRMNDLERDIRSALQKIEGKSGFNADVKRFAFRGIALFDAAVSIPTWIGAYNKGLKDGMTDADASFYADKMVRDTQGAGAAKDLAAIQRGGPLMKLFTMFYSYFNVFYNRQRGLARDVREVRSTAQAMDVLAQSFWLLVVPSLLAPLLSGQGPDDDEEWGSWVGRNLGFGLFSGVPYVRDAANTLSNLVGGKGNFGGTKLSPVQTIWDTAIHTGRDVVHLVKGEDASETWLKSAANMGGLFTGLPTGQAGATSQFLWDALISGSQNPESLKDWMSGLAYGPHKKK